MILALTLAGVLAAAPQDSTPAPAIATGTLRGPAETSASVALLSYIMMWKPIRRD